MNLNRQTIDTVPPGFASSLELAGNQAAPAVNPKSDSLFESAKVMMVDRDRQVIDQVEACLKQAGIEDMLACLDPSEAADQIGFKQPDIVLIDICDGFDILRTLRRMAFLETAGVIIMGENIAPEEKLAALQLGASAFLTKPVDNSELMVSIRNIMASKAYQDHLTHESSRLECEVRQRMVELEAARNEAEEARHEAMHCLARAAEFRDDDTGNHVLRVGRYAGIIAEQLGWDRQRCDLLEQAAQLHDVGKIGISDTILLKPGKLTDDEFETMKQHCEYGSKIILPMSDAEWNELMSNPDQTFEIISDSSSPVMKLAALIAQTHHEKWDGTGYPRGLQGDEIPLSGRITAIADVFDALSSERPYKDAFSVEKCCRIINEGKGSHFDPQVVEAFFDVIDDIVDILNILADA